LSEVPFMRRALELARRGVGLAPPNPMVGAVVVRQGTLVGEGWHEGPGTPHAEVMALAEAGDGARGATLYVTLEPCSHQGRTPPCAPAVLEAGIARVVAGQRDPNPVVDGRGLELLRGAGVDVVEGVLAEETARLIGGFAKHTRTGLPLVTLKLAMSLDGKVAAADRSSRWITGDAARRDAHELRASSGAIVIGAGTALADDPSLTVRVDGYRGRAPVRVLLDGRGRTPDGAKLFRGDAPTLVATTHACPPEVRAAWEAKGAEVLILGEPVQDAGSDLVCLLELLGKREIQDVLIEGGPTLAWSAVGRGLVDRLVVYVAPKLIGGDVAPSALGGIGIAAISDAIPVDIKGVAWVGMDLRIEADVHGHS
jgi:diaminohydroxyphosphoribosylaminopyrimidine deaminase/5-amino-6-(5-phosphoribosylamino)uracil reductase